MSESAVIVVFIFATSIRILTAEGIRQTARMAVEGIAANLIFLALLGKIS